MSGGILRVNEIQKGDGTAFPIGKVLQVKSTTKTDTFGATLAGNAKTDITGLSVSITPSSTSSKILIFYSVQGVSGQANRFVNFGLVLRRDSSDIILGDTAGSRQRTTNFLTVRANANDGNTGGTVSYNYLDTPSSTSSLTYKVALQNISNSSTTYQINRTFSDADNNNYRPRGTSSITVMEIGA